MCAFVVAAIDSPTLSIRYIGLGHQKCHIVCVCLHRLVGCSCILMHHFVICKHQPMIALCEIDVLPHHDACHYKWSSGNGNVVQCLSQFGVDQIAFRVWMQNIAGSLKRNWSHLLHVEHNVCTIWKSFKQLQFAAISYIRLCMPQLVNSRKCFSSVNV